MREPERNQIVGLNADEEPNGVWYPLSKCELYEDGRYNVKVLDTDAAIEAGMANAEAEGVDPMFIRETQSSLNETKPRVDKHSSEVQVLILSGLPSKSV
mmetsp:Transcript_33675/g.81563  ORF Transcript_33675/g.81563 Transcript_33675/m.81563 type:complete len:99 (+) Transcript_33675:36-332(+)